MTLNKLRFAARTEGTMSKATDAQIADLARTTADQSMAIAEGTVVGPRYSAALRLCGNVETLAAWIDDDRAHSVRGVIGEASADTLEPVGTDK